MSLSTSSYIYSFHHDSGTKSLHHGMIICGNDYAPNFEKVGSILVSACAFVRSSGQNRIQARVLKFHIWIPHQKIAYPYFFSCLNYLPLPSYAPFKG